MAWRGVAWRGKDTVKKTHGCVVLFGGGGPAAAGGVALEMEAEAAGRVSVTGGIHSSAREMRCVTKPPTMGMSRSAV